MKGNEKLLEVLNTLLADELTAINQYMEIFTMYNLRENIYDFTIFNLQCTIYVPIKSD